MIEPGTERLEYWNAFGLTGSVACVDIQAPDLALDAIEFAEEGHGLIGPAGKPFGLRPLRVTEAPPGVNQAAQMLNPGLSGELVIAFIAIGHQVATKAGQQPLGHFAGAGGMVVKENDGPLGGSGGGNR